MMCIPHTFYLLKFTIKIVCQQFLVSVFFDLTLWIEVDVLEVHCFCTERLSIIVILIGMCGCRSRWTVEWGQSPEIS